MKKSSTESPTSWCQGCRRTAEARQPEPPSRALLLHPQPLPGPANWVVKLFSNQLELNNVPVSQPSDSPGCRQPWQTISNTQQSTFRNLAPGRDSTVHPPRFITACLHNTPYPISWGRYRWMNGPDKQPMRGQTPDHQEHTEDPNTEPTSMVIPITDNWRRINQ